MDDLDLEAFRPIPFPEIGPGVTFNANFCRNPMCPNFGPAPDSGACAERYEVEAHANFLADRYYRCRICRTRSRLLSNLSLRSAYVWFKRQSMPFAACRQPGCKNEGVNVFEHSGRYESKARDRAKCRECKSSFSLGEALQVHTELDEPGDLEWRLEQIFEFAHRRRGMLEGMDDLKHPRANPAHYRAALRSVGMRVLDYQAYCTATGFMDPDYPERLRRLFAETNRGKDPGPKDSPYNGTATLRTDMFYGSLRKPREAYRPRFQLLPVLVTALRFHKPATFLVLASHPCVMFRKRDVPPKDPAEAMADSTLPVARRRFDHLFHFGTDHGDTALSGNATSYLGGGALFMRDEYAELAHFMVLKELTNGFDRVTLTLDGKYTAYRSAAAIFAADMRTRVAGKKAVGDEEEDSDIRRAEIAVVQIADPEERAKHPETEDLSWKSETERLDRDWRSGMEAELGQDGDLLGGEEPERHAVARAKLFQRVMHGGWSERGSWGWRKRRGRKNSLLAVLWLSQGPDRDWLPCEEIDTFLALASPQSVDSAIGGLRRRALAVVRAKSRAEQGQGYGDAMVNAEYASCQIWISWFALNFVRPDRSLVRGKHPAQWAGLLPWDAEGSPDIAGDLGFRLGWRDAREMTRRLGNG